MVDALGNFPLNKADNCLSRKADFHSMETKGTCIILGLFSNNTDIYFKERGNTEMGEESSCSLDGIDKDILKQMKLRRREILTNISDLPSSKKEIVIKKLDELIILANKARQ